MWLKTEEGPPGLQIHQMRRRYRKRIEDEIAQTVSDPVEQTAELDDLVAAMGRAPLSTSVPIFARQLPNAHIAVERLAGPVLQGDAAFLHRSERLANVPPLQRVAHRCVR